jgi:hypothetical protein
MAESGQSHPFDPVPGTSGLSRTTDIIGPARLVRLVPTTEVIEPVAMALREYLNSQHLFVSKYFSAQALGYDFFWRPSHELQAG